MYSVNQTDPPTLIVMSRFASLNPNIYITADPTPVAGAHVLHVGGLTLCTRRIMTTYLL